MTLEQQISKGIMEAMKAKDTVRLMALRNVKKYIIEAKTATTGLAELPDADTLKIIQKLCKQGTDSAEVYKSSGRDDLASEELAQVEVLKEFLPAQMSDEELTDAVRAIITEVGAQSMKDMGRVMGIASKTLAGKAEGRAISDKVKQLLG
ncbi:MAG: GatB/YqeY domain-containing protein [Rikenellaceae bacterium]|nr:GatB/YqeY domain-containing protein [Rikenellaceae bacterium]